MSATLLWMWYWRTYYFLNWITIRQTIKPVNDCRQSPQIFINNSKNVAYTSQHLQAIVDTNKPVITRVRAEMFGVINIRVRTDGKCWNNFLAYLNWYLSITYIRDADTAQLLQKKLSQHKHRSGHLSSPNVPAWKQHILRYPWQHEYPLISPWRTFLLRKYWVRQQLNGQNWPKHHKNV